MSTRQAVAALYKLAMLCLLGWLPAVQLAASDAAEIEARPDPELLMFIAAFSDQGQFLDPQALDQMMMQMVTGSDAQAASAQAGSQQSGDSNDQDEETEHEQQ